MTAKEMFEKLGYKQVENMHKGSLLIEEDCIIYENTYSNDFIYYVFELNHKRFIKWCYSHQCICWVHNNERKAINKQIEELGWNNE